MFNGIGNETDTRGRWGDYTITNIDPSDGMTFWHVNQYYPTVGPVSIGSSASANSIS